MTTWHYAMSRERDEEGNTHYGLVEVYVDGKNALSWSDPVMNLAGERWIEAADDLSKVTRAVGAPVLDLTLDPPRLVSPTDLAEGEVDVELPDDGGSGPVDLESDSPG